MPYTQEGLESISQQEWDMTSERKRLILEYYKFNSIGKQEVQISDQTTPSLILPMVNQVAVSNLSIGGVKFEYTATVDSVVGFVVGQHVRIINAAADRYYSGELLTIVGNVFTFDTQLDFDYIAGSEITGSNINMAVDGSVTPVVFTLRTGSPSIPSDVDITRIILLGTCLTPVDLSLFGDLTKLTRGLAFRSNNGITSNIFNVKTNADMENMTLDWNPYSALKVNEGVDGFSCRLTAAGQDKLGVAWRIVPEGNLEMIVQDNLSGLLTLTAILEGHVVLP